MQPDITPCRGLRESDTVQPISQCRTCQRWLTAHRANEYAIFLAISGSDLIVINGRIVCVERIRPE